MTQPAIVLEGVCRAFGGREVLHRVDLAIARGELYMLVGANGGGKTTLIEILATLLLPTCGSVRVHGCDAVADSRSVRRLIGYCPSALNSFYLRLSGAQNLAFFGALAGLDPEAGRARAAALLERVGLGGAAALRVDKYSDGMKARLGIARALIADPPVLLLDEPTKSIDPAGRDAMRTLLREAGPDGEPRTILWVTHHRDELALADRCGTLAGGRLVDAAPRRARALAALAAS
jgi:ABC-2 type transport system ATP-binding protein